MNSQLFVSKYQLALPDEAEMCAFVEARLKEEMPALEPSRQKTSKKKRGKAR